MKAYSEYKYSGIEWLGQIPSHWAISTYKYHCTSRMGQTILKEDMTETGVPIYSATQDDSILGYISDPELLLHKGDLVIPARGNSIGYVSKVEFENATCTQTTICSTQLKDVDADFLLYCCKAFKNTWFLFDHTAIPQITVNQVENNKLPLPPIEEQEIIAAYLDEVTGKVDALIAEKQKQIEDLRSYRISLITETVSRGLNHDMPLRNSGIDWLGDMPQHWISTKAKYYIEVKSGDPIDKNDIIPRGSVPIFGGGEIIGFTVTSNVPPQTIIVGRVGARCGCVRLTSVESWATDNALVISTLQNPQYLTCIFEAANLNRLNESNAQPLITATKIKDLGIPLPPLEEQQAIADFLDEKTAKTDTLIDELEKQLGELAEYKKAVISEAVTGKVDVRDWKPNN